MAEWRECTIGDVMTLQRGFDITKKNQNPGCIPVVSSSGINSFNDTYKVESPGVVIGRKGTLGTVFFVNENYWPHDTTLWVKDFKDNAPRFVYYFLQSIDLSVHDVGSSNPTLNRNHVHLLPCSLPPLPEQRAIASVLSSLDDKIDLLHRQNKTLEAMAETLFRQWFVEEADEGWEEVPLSMFADNIRDNVKVEDLSNHNLYVGLEHIPRRRIILDSWGETNTLESNKSLFRQHDILFGKLRSYFHKVVYAPIDGVCSTDILVIRPRKAQWLPFCLFWFFSKEVVEHSDLGSGGTRMPRTNWNIVSNYKVPYPNEKLILDFDRIVRPSLNKMFQNIESIHTLEKLRDTLLPKLMSGEVRVEVSQ